MFVGAGAGGAFVTGAAVGGTVVVVDAGVSVGIGVKVLVGLGVALGSVVAVGKERTRVTTGVSEAGRLCGLNTKKSVPPIRIHPNKAIAPARIKGATDKRVRFCVIEFSHKGPAGSVGRDYICWKTGPQHTAAGANGWCAGFDQARRWGTAVWVSGALLKS